MVTLPGNIAWLSPAEGWVEVSSSAGYGLICYQAIPQPAACRQAITRIYATHDGGLHWHTDMSGLPHGVPAPNATTGVFPDAELGQPLFFGKVGILPMTVRICRRAHVPTNYVCTSGLYTLLTHDGGQTWPLTRRFPFTVDSLHRLAWQVMTPKAWRALVGTKLWFTDDAGAHWTAIPAAIPSGYTPVVVQFATSTTGWAIAAQIYQPDNVAQTTQLLRTDDGGRHWSIIPLPRV